ncbi:hypothetical protein ABZ322_01795 [Streptomyces sp. NPDC006129]|uniref:hypothetical protein n=1 Tax=Streptomyces sp. NPDC006129 TaxID=3155348 RepID=UPI0033A7E37A
MAVVTPDTMDADAYREFCWGAGLERTDTGYGLLQAVDDHSGDAVTEVIDDVDYMQLLTQSSGVAVPADKIVQALPDWPDLRPGAAAVRP